MFYLSQSELLLHLFLTAALFGMIWIIQLLHYPSFKYIAEEQWPAFHKQKTSQGNAIMMPLMICELGIAAWLAGKNGFHFDYAIPLCLVLAIWLSTIFIQFPIINRLAEQKEEALIDRLIQSNWIRTLLWSAKLIWVSWMSYSIWG